MDSAWDAVAQKYGFECNGCSDNCCQSLFYHHTHVEKAYLNHGLKHLATEKQKIILRRAADYVKITFQSHGHGHSKKIMCPANEDGKCLLYPYRPMICRLHGLPHELSRPGSAPVKGPGCDAGNFTAYNYIPFDRTPFYRQMARIEMQFQTSTQQSGRIKETIAQMLLG